MKKIIILSLIMINGALCGVERTLINTTNVPVLVSYMPDINLPVAQLKMETVTLPPNHEVKINTQPSFSFAAAELIGPRQLGNERVFIHRDEEFKAEPEELAIEATQIRPISYYSEGKISELQEFDPETGSLEYYPNPEEPKLELEFGDQDIDQDI